MESSEFTAVLQEALGKYKTYLDRNVVGGLKENFRIFHTAFMAIYSMLMRKGLVHDDPYKHDIKISEVSVPSDAPVADHERDDQLSMRLSSFESQLDFLMNYYQFSVDFIDLPRIKQLLGMTKYITWDQFIETSTHFTTMMLATQVAKIRKGGDNLSVGILSDSLDQLMKTGKSILNILKDLTTYHKEYYKLEIRMSILPGMNIDMGKVMNSRDDVLKQIKRRFVSDFPEKPFFPELVVDLLDEDFSGESVERQRQVLDRIKVRDDKPKQEKKGVSFSEMLMEAIRAIAGVSHHLEEAMVKLNDNHLLIINRKVTFYEKFQRWLRKLINQKEPPILYEIEFFEETTGVTKHETIDFRSFYEDVQGKVKIYNGILSKLGTIYQKIERASEDQMFIFLNKHLEDLHQIEHRLNGLDTYFKLEIPREQRMNLRGIKSELTSIKNGIVKANQKKHEYVAKKEEFEQMRKLGIDMSTAL